MPGMLVTAGRAAGRTMDDQTFGRSSAGSPGGRFGLIREHERSDGSEGRLGGSEDILDGHDWPKNKNKVM